MKIKSTSGFTLIELLIAITILAIISAMAYSGLNSVLKSHEILKSQQERFNQINRIITQLQQEIRHLVPRPVYDKYGNTLIPALRLESTNVLVFSFTRGGIPNPAGLPKNSLQRIDYFFSQSTLKKQTWLSMDRNNSADYKEEIIANNLKQFRVEVLGFNGQWYPQWPINKTDAPDSLPKAVRFSFATQESGDIGRIIELPL